MNLFLNHKNHLDFLIDLKHKYFLKWKLDYIIHENSRFWVFMGLWVWVWAWNPNFMGFSIWFQTQTHTRNPIFFEFSCMDYIYYYGCKLNVHERKFFGERLVSAFVYIHLHSFFSYLRTKKNYFELTIIKVEKLNSPSLSVLGLNFELT